MHDWLIRCYCLCRHCPRSRYFCSGLDLKHQMDVALSSNIWKLNQQIYCIFLCLQLDIRLPYLQRDCGKFLGALDTLTIQNMSCPLIEATVASENVLCEICCRNLWQVFAAATANNEICIVEVKLPGIPFSLRWLRPTQNRPKYQKGWNLLPLLLKASLELEKHLGNLLLFGTSSVRKSSAKPAVGLFLALL